MRWHPAAMLRHMRASQLVRFLMAGVLNTAFGYALYLVGLVLGLPPEVALGIATLLGAFFNYFTTARFVFSHSSMNMMPRFIATYAIIYALNALTLRGLIYAGMGAALAQALLLPIFAMASFLAFKFLVFRGVREQ